MDAGNAYRFVAQLKTMYALFRKRYLILGWPQDLTDFCEFCHCHLFFATICTRRGSCSRGSATGHASKIASCRSSEQSGICFAFDKLFLSRIEMLMNQILRLPHFIPAYDTVQTSLYPSSQISPKFPRAFLVNAIVNSAISDALESQIQLHTNLLV
jgi:hypothetical protein